MGYLGQKYDKGLVIQRSPEGSAFQEEVNVVADGDTEVTPKVGGGLKKVNITGGGSGIADVEVNGTSVVNEGVANIQLKTVSGNSIEGEGNVNIPTYLPFDANWDNSTIATLLVDVNADSNAVVGESYLGEVVSVTAAEGLFNGNAEVRLDIMDDSSMGKIILGTVTSSDTEPYHWEATFIDGAISAKGWTGFQPKLVSEINIKTVNNNSLLGSGNINVTDNNYTNADKKAVDTVGNYIVEEYSDPQGNYTLASFASEEVVNYVYTRLNFAGVDPNEFSQNIWSEGLLDLKNLNKLNKYKFNFTLIPTINNVRDEEHTMYVSLSLDDFDLEISDANACDATIGELRTINNFPFPDNISAYVNIGCVLHIEIDSETGDSRAEISGFYATLDGDSILPYDSGLVIDHIAVVYPENGVWFGQNNYPTTDGDYVLNVDGEIPSYKKFAVNPTLEGGESNLSGLQIGDTKYAVPQGTNVVANPTLVGTEANLNGLQVGNTKYKVGGDPDIIPLLDSTNTVFDGETSAAQYGLPILIEDNSDALTSYQQAFLQMIRRVVGDKFSVTPFHNESTGEEDAVVNPVFISIPFKKPIQGFYEYEYDHGHIQDGESHTYAQLRTKTNLLSIYLGSGVGTGGNLSIDAINYSDYENSSRGGGVPRVLEVNDYELDHTYGILDCVGGEYESCLWSFFFAGESNGMWINENPLLEGNVYVTYKYYRDPYSSNPELRTEKVALTAAEIQTIRYLVTAKVSKCDVHGGS